MKKTIEIILKFAISMSITIAIVANYAPKDHGEILAIASPLSTVAGILFGFIIAYITAFVSNSSNELLQNMKKTNMYSPLLSQLSYTGFGLIISCIFMVISIFTPHKYIFDDHLYTWDYTLLIIGFATLIYSLINFLVSWYKVHTIVKYL